MSAAAVSVVVSAAVVSDGAWSPQLTTIAIGSSGSPYATSSSSETADGS